MANRQTATHRCSLPHSLAASTGTSPIVTERAGCIEDSSAGLLSALKQRTTDAFGRLIRLHERRLFSTAMRITGNREDAEDAVQNTFLQVHRHIDGFRGECQFTSWLTQILINQALMVLRRRRNSPVSIDDCTADGLEATPLDIKAPCHTPEENFLKKELSERLVRAIQKLRGRNRGVAELHYLQQLSTDEIANAMGISISAAKSRLLRARKQLRRDGPKQLDPPIRTCSVLYGRTQINGRWGAARGSELRDGK